MKKTFLISALIASGLTTATFAQDAATPAPSTPDSTSPGATMPSQTSGSVLLMDQQVDGQRLTSKVIGTAVYSTAGEHIGDINDVIIGSDGKVRGYLVGVGGFLGIGEKNVALSFDAVSPSVDNSGNPRLVVNLTKETLQDVPAFSSVDNG